MARLFGARSTFLPFLFSSFSTLSKKTTTSLSTHPLLNSPSLLDYSFPTTIHPPNLLNIYSSLHHSLHPSMFFSLTHLLFFHLLISFFFKNSSIPSNLSSFMQQLEVNVLSPYNSLLIHRECTFN